MAPYFFIFFFEIGAGGTAQLVGPCHPQAALQAPLFTKTARIIFHKLTIIPSINPTSSSTFPDKPLYFFVIPEQHNIE
jgi:hypothetical protein